MTYRNLALPTAIPSGGTDICLGFVLLARGDKATGLLPLRPSFGVLPNLSLFDVGAT